MQVTKEDIKKAITSMPSKRELQELDGENAIVVLSQGTLVDGDPYYAYIAVDPSKFIAFKAAEKLGNYDVAEYGTILKWERKAEPPKEVMEEMEKTLGLDHEYENKVMKALKELKEEN